MVRCFTFLELDLGISGVGLDVSLEEILKDILSESRKGSETNILSSIIVFLKM